MHNRDMIWETKEGEISKIRDMSSNHLVNILNFIDKNIIAYETLWGKKMIKESKYNIKQEIRLRKLNMIEINNQINNQKELF